MGWAQIHWRKELSALVFQPNYLVWYSVPDFCWRQPLGNLFTDTYFGDIHFLVSTSKVGAIGG
jgi:hypothetical protein